MSGRKRAAGRKASKNDSQLRVVRMEEPDLDLAGEVGADRDLTALTTDGDTKPAPRADQESVEPSCLVDFQTGNETPAEVVLPFEAAEVADNDEVADEQEALPGQPTNLLQTLDRRQNEVLEELDRLNAQIDTLISELQQQRAENQAA